MIRLAVKRKPAMKRKAAMKKAKLLMKTKSVMVTKSMTKKATLNDPHDYGQGPPTTLRHRVACPAGGQWFVPRNAGIGLVLPNDEGVTPYPFPTMSWSRLMVVDGGLNKFSGGLERVLDFPLW